jgi:hypothetical protein
MAGLETQTIDRVKIIDDEDGHIVAVRGRVDINGETVKIYEWDTGLARFVQVDRLTDAKVRQAHKGCTLVSGISQHYLRQVGTPKTDAARSFKLELGKGLPLTDERA